MFATAAVLDMRKKEERTREWDRAIEEVRSGKDWESIRTPDTISIGKQAEPGRNIMGKEIYGYTPDANIVKAMKGLSVGKLVGTVSMPMAEAHEKSAQGRKGIHAVRDELDRILAGITKTSGETAVAAQEATETDVAPVEEVDNSIFAERGPDGMQNTNFREMKMGTWEPTSPLYANQVGELVSKLVYNLLSTVSAGAKDKATPEVDDADSTRSAIHQRRKRQAELKAMAIYQEISELSERGSFPSYTIPNPSHAAMERKALNDSIVHLTSDGLNKRGHRSMDQMVAGICYNLLASSVSPDITTFNIMIERFTRYKQHDLASHVISFLENSPFRANERTISAILNHYRAKNYEIGFRRTINRIRGFEGGLGLTEIKSGKIVRSKFAAIWASKNDFVFKKGVLRETAKINGQLYETLIRGCLQFGQLGQALGYMRTAIQQGNVVRKKLFHEIIKFCENSERPQYYLTLLLGAMVRQFADGLEKARGIQYDFYVRETVHHILQAIGITEPTVEGLRKLQRSTCMPCDIHPRNFEAMLEHLEHEEIKDDFISLYREAGLVEKKIHNLKVAISGRRRIRRLLEDIPSTKKLADREEAHVKAQFFLGNEDWVRNLGLPRRTAEEYLKIVNRIDPDELFSLSEARLEVLGILSPGVRTRLVERVQLLQADLLPPVPVMEKKDRLAAVQTLNAYQKGIKTVQRNTVKNVYREFPQDVRLRYTNLIKTKNISQRDALMVLLETRRILSLEGRLINPKEEQPAIDAEKIIEGQKAIEPETTQDMLTAVLGDLAPKTKAEVEEKEKEKEYKMPQFKEPGYFDPTPEIRWAPLELTPNGYIRRPIPNADIRVHI